MSEKVKLPREVVEAIKGVFHLNQPFMREEQFHGIIHMQKDEPCTPDQATIYNYFYEKGWLVLAQALINGWAVEQTPEDMVRLLYDQHSGSDDRKYRGMAIGIKETLDILNIKIKGVNADE